jgi:hypothetical protein
VIWIFLLLSTFKLYWMKFWYFKCGRLLRNVNLTQISILWMLEFWFGSFVSFEFLSHCSIDDWNTSF